MSARTAQLHTALLAALGGRVASHSDLETKPLEIDLLPPESLRLRVYMYSLVGGIGERARHEYKVVLRVPGQPRGVYRGFDQSDGRFTTVIGYGHDLDVFVMWDASLHGRFKNGTNLRVGDSLVRSAAAAGIADTVRVLTSGVRELILLGQSSNVSEILRTRIATTGGVMEGEWSASPN